MNTQQCGIYQKNFTRVVPLILVLAGGVVYSNSLSGPFIFDDPASILDNPNVRHLWPIWEAMSAPRSTGMSSRPVAALSLAINYALGGYHVLGYHLFNIAIHILTALALFGVVHHTLALFVYKEEKKASAFWLGLTTGLIFLVHPLPTDALNHMTYRHEVLMSLFYLLTLYCAIRSARSTRQGWWIIAAMLCCSLGMGSKENMVSAPLMVLLYDRVFLSTSFAEALRKRWNLHAGLALTWLILAASILSGYRGNLVGFDLQDLRPYEYALTQLGVVVYYLRLAVWPDPMVLDYFGWPVAHSLVDVWPQALAVAALVGLTCWGLWCRKWWGLLGALLFFILSPTSLIPNAGEVVAEHRMYLPLAGVVLLGVLSGHALLRFMVKRLVLSGHTHRYIAGVLVAVVVAILGYATNRRNKDYRSEIAIWSDTVEKRPGNARAHNNLGNEYLKTGRLELGRAHLYRALDLKPDFTEAFINLGIASAQLGRLEEALGYYSKALSINSDWPKIHNNIGLVLFRMGHAQDAVRFLNQAITLDANLSIAYNNLGLVLAEQGQFEEALSHFNKALALDPHLAEIHTNLGQLYLNRGNVQLATEWLSKALELNPDYVEAHYQMGLTLAAQGQHDAAQAKYELVVRNHPAHIPAQRTLGLMLLQQNRIEDAIVHFETVLRLKPEEVGSLNNLGNALRRMGRREEAIEHYQKAIQLAPEDITGFINLGLALIELGKLSQAEKYLSEALRLDNNSAEAHNNMGIVLARSNRTEEAIEHFQETLRINPDLEAARSNLEFLLNQLNESNSGPTD